MDNKARITELKDKLDTLQKERKTYNTELRNLEFEEIKPELEEKYKGKFWKYRNGHSDEQWWLYSTCLEITNKRSSIVNSFEKTPENVSFNFKQEAGLYLCEYEITKEEFSEAFLECSQFLKSFNL